MMKRLISVIVYLLLIWIIGCAGEKTDEVALAKQEFETGLYSKAEIRLDQFVQEHPQDAEAYCLLAAAYNRQGKTQKLEMAAGKLRGMGKPAMDKLVSIMKYDPNMAEDMVRILTLVGEPAVDALISALGDPTERVRNSAVSVLIEIGTPAEDRLIASLESSDVFTRVNSARILGHVGDEKKAMEPLTKRMEDGSPHVRIEAAAALYKLGDKSHVDVIADGLSSELLSARRAAAAAMEEAVEEPPVELLLEAAEDSDIEVKASAISALGKAKDEKAVALLVKSLSSKDDITRNAAAEALKAMGELAVMPLVELIGSEKDEGTLYKAVQILGDIGDKRAVEALDKVYAEDTRPLIRQEAAIALNKIE